MAKGQNHLTGMHGVFLAAAELTSRGLIVSLTSRGAKGADILATDPDCKSMWVVQVKTSKADDGFWLVGEHGKTMASPGFVYIFVVLNSGDPIYYIVPSAVVAEATRVEVNKNSTWYSYYRDEAYRDNWTVFQISE